MRECVISRDDTVVNPAVFFASSPGRIQFFPAKECSLGR